MRTDLPAQLAAAAAPERFVGHAGARARPLLVRATAARLVEAGWRDGDAVVLAAAGSSDAAALAEVRGAGRMLGRRWAGACGRVRGDGRPAGGRLVAELRAAGERRVAVASWLLAPGVFHTRLAAVGADVVAAPLGAHPDVVAAVVARYTAASAGGLAHGGLIPRVGTLVARVAVPNWRASRDELARDAPEPAHESRHSCANRYDSRETGARRAG